MGESTIFKILRHEGFAACKLTSLALSIQLILQVLPLPQPHYSVLSWLFVTGSVIAVGFKSDIKYYSSATGFHIKWERLSSNFTYFLFTCTAALYLVKFLEISNLSTLEDKEMLDATGNEGPDFFQTKLMLDFGNISGLLLLLSTHYLALFALVCLLRICLIILQEILVGIAKCVSKTNRKGCWRAEKEGMRK